ncbi:hypothetical protein [Spiribacter pallidus]|uniref:DUF4020 domain-containing protein n=1 Tax=Spiribacter pallidus TaxID=1987936 RepID=A0ABV3TE98_9GAMM
MTALVDWKVRLRAKHVFTPLDELAANEDLQTGLPDLLDDFSALLRDALDLMRAMGGADDHQDRSFLAWPSITDHAQNADYDEWVALIVLARDAWLATASIQPERAALAAKTWWHLPYPCFKRLALFAAAQGNLIPPEDAVDWLLDEDAHWLWSPQVQREVMRLLVSLGARIGAPARWRLETAILAGSDRHEVDGTDDDERRRAAADRSVWLRLIRLKEGDTDALGEDADERLASLETAYPQWPIAPDDGDDFPLRWLDGSELGEPIPTPYRCKDLVDWLQRHPSRDDWNDDAWAERCRHAFPAAVCALKALACRDVWVTDRWAEALNAWRGQHHLRQSWRRLAPLLMRMPDDQFTEILPAVTHWIERVAEARQPADRQLLALVDRIFHASEVAENDEEFQAFGDDPLIAAINEPIGHTTQALINAWHGEALKDGQGLRELIRLRFEQVLNSPQPRYIRGRVVLARDAVTLFRVDPEWTTHNLLPWFDWQTRPDAAAAVWQGFLSAGRLHPPMLLTMKASFLETAGHYPELGVLGDNYAAMLVSLGLQQDNRFEAAELRKALEAIGDEGLAQAARALTRGLAAADDRRQAYFEHRVVPFVDEVWLRTENMVSSRVAEALAELCIVADENFPEALCLVRHWLVPVAYPYGLIHRLRESGLCERFPEAALRFLGSVIKTTSRWSPGDLILCLEAIASAMPVLSDDPVFNRLKNLNGIP